MCSIRINITCPIGSHRVPSGPIGSHLVPSYTHTHPSLKTMLCLHTKYAFILLPTIGLNGATGVVGATCATWGSSSHVANFTINFSIFALASVAGVVNFFFFSHSKFFFFFFKRKRVFRVVSAYGAPEYTLYT